MHALRKELSDTLRNIAVSLKPVFAPISQREDTTRIHPSRRRRQYQRNPSANKVAKVPQSRLVHLFSLGYLNEFFSHADEAWIELCHLNDTDEALLVDYILQSTVMWLEMEYFVIRQAYDEEEKETEDSKAKSKSLYVVDNVLLVIDLLQLCVDKFSSQVATRFSVMLYFYLTFLKL